MEEKKIYFNLGSEYAYDEETGEFVEINSCITEDNEISPLSIENDMSTLGTYSWAGGTMSNTVPVHQVGVVNSSGSTTAHRVYMNFSLPVLPRNPRIKKAELTFYQTGGMPTFNGGVPKLGLYQVTEDITIGTCTPAYNTNLLDYEYMKPEVTSDTPISYTFDITKLVDAVNKGELSSSKLMLKALDESVSTSGYVVLGGSGYSAKKPVISITYESSYGVNTSYRTHTHEIGRFGQGSVDLQCGNLMFEMEDFAWAGNRMPVTIKHLYNSAYGAYQYTANSAIGLNTADFSAMKIGYGWKLNIMQSMVAAAFVHEGTDHSGYVYIGENGEEHYFVQSGETRTDESGNTYYLYEDAEDGGMIYDPTTLVLEQGEEKYLFDDSGRLVKVTDGYGNHMDIVYDSGRITYVTDGAGRGFDFTYNSNGYLTGITAPDDTSMSYSYNGNLISTVTYPDGSKVFMANNTKTVIMLMTYQKNGLPLTQYNYTYSGERITKVKESGYTGNGFETGLTYDFDYSAASRRTIVTTTEPADTDEGETSDNVIRTVYTFDDEGNVVSEYMNSAETGNTGVDGGTGPGEGVVSNATNLLKGHNFESLDEWTATELNSATFTAVSSTYENVSKFGNLVLYLDSHDSTAAERGVYQQTNSLPAGEYTFSAYIKVVRAFVEDTTAGAYIRVTDTSGNLLSESEHLIHKESEYIRLAASFELTTAKSVNVHILLDGDGTIYADGAQLEKNPYANPYNMILNGNFENNLTGWTVSNAAVATDEFFDMTKSAKVTGGVTSSAYLYQNIVVKKRASTRETFTLSGWAKGYGLVEREREQGNVPTFRLRALLQYSDNSTETYTADFSPCTEEWQYASVQFAKSQYKTLKNFKVYCDYDYNFGTAYFDNIGLVRDSIETGLGAGDFVLESDYEEDEEAEYLEESVEDTAPEFEELLDAFGNALTETTYSDGEFGTLYRAFGYNEATSSSATDAGNNLVSETDARGNETTYTVDAETSRNTEVTDRLGNRTAYEYDEMGRTTKVTSKNSSGTTLGTVAYTYDSQDNMTSITRGDGMKYELGYNDYKNLESIGISGKDEKLVQYTYKTGNGRLKQVTYANGDYMKASYNSIGQLVAEKWYDSADTLTAHYKYVHDGEGNVVRSIDVLSLKEYNYSYEDGRIVRATECDVTLNSSELVTKKNLVNSILYYYDAEGELTRKRIIPATGEEQVIYYESPENENTVVKFTAGGKTVTSHSKNDSFGRKVFDELQLGTGFVSRQFDYLAGEITEEHMEGDKLKSTPTTQLISRITMSDGRMIDYEYDEEERITKVIDSIDGTTVYTYDALGQLLTETVNGSAVNTMTYDSYGNIRTKNGTAYTYGDSVWKDKLTKVGTKTITYDAQGNPTNYLGNTLTWEKGRQLKQFTKSDGTAVSYTYNANGIRTSKTVGGTKHTYTLDGTKILSEVWGSNTLIPLYDNEDEVCGVIYNNTPYYFYKNQQGDVVEIVDKDASVVARYTYDAWGKLLAVTDANGTTITSTTHIANVNPYRYRGYYYDVETKLYYLQSRYYDPEVGRFVNGDELSYLGARGTVLGYNLFAYCENNPVNNVDYFGNMTIELGVWGALVIAGLAVLTWATAKLLAELLVLIVKLIWKVGKKIIAKAKDVIEVVQQSLTKAQARVKTLKMEKHHIIARTASKMETSRKIWVKKCGYSINDGRNLVSMNYNLHKVIHTNLWYTTVDSCVKVAYDKGGRKQVVNTVAAIKLILQVASSVL